MTSGLLNYIINLLNANLELGVPNIDETGLLVQVLILYIAYLFFEIKISKIAQTKEVAYTGDNLLLDFFRNTSGTKFYLFIIISALIFVPFTTWKIIDVNGLVKPLILTLSLLLGITFSLYSYNFYLNKKHLFERILLITTSLLVYIHPFFILPTLYLAYMLIGQFFYPFYNSWTDKVMTLKLNTLVVPFVLLNGLGFHISPYALIMTMLIVWSYVYFITGFGKIKMNWHKYNQLTNLIYANKHQNNWNKFLSKKSFKVMINVFQKLNPIFLYGTLILELGVIVILLNAKYALFLILGLTFFHVIIFFSTGIFFWKNIIINIILVIIIYSIEVNGLMFGIYPALISGGLIYLSIRASEKTPQLYWWDSPASFKVVFMANTSKNEEIQLVSSDFAPFDIVFAQGRFYNCFTSPKIVGCFGLVNSKEELDFLNNLKGKKRKLFFKDREYVELAENENATTLVQFLKTFISHFNQNKKKFDLSFIQAPKHILSTPETRRISKKDHIESISIYVSEAYKNEEMFRKKVFTVFND